MPSGKVHNSINQSVFISCLIIILIKYLFDDCEYIVIGLGIGINYLGPDLDKAGTIQDQNWGMYGLYWDIYSWLMPHRGFSHSIFGIISRILFLMPPVLLISMVSNRFVFSFDILLDRKFLFVCIGIIFADLLHIIADKIIKNK